MPDDKVVTSGFGVTPDAIASRTFTTAFRGFDQAEVKAFLQRVSDELAGAAEREAQLRRMLQEAQNRAAHPEVDESVLMSALGEHAAKLLTSAREQAQAIRGEAEAKAARLMRDAESQIARIRAEADSLLARRVEEVDGVTANLRNAAEADARALRDQAQADVEAEVAAARTQGREMVAEARTVRERILADLARRRHIAEMQLDQLRAARERLLSAYALVRRTLDEATQELKTAEVEARLAADEVARRTPEPPPAPSSDEPTPPRGQSALQLAGATASAGRASATSVRAPRFDPVVRSEPRQRPPGRPGEARPTPPSRRPPDFRSPPEPEPPAARQPPELPRTEPATRPPLAPAPEPARALAPPAPPSPPSIVPRPVPPPPSRPTPVPVSREPAASPPGPGSSDRVDALFARIKADRAVTVAQAQAAETTEAVEAGEATAPPPPTEAPSGGVTTWDAEPPPPDRPRSGAASREIVDEAARVRRDDALEPIETNLIRQMKRVLQDEQNEVLDRLRRKRRQRDGGPLLPADEQRGRFREAAQHLLEEAGRAGAAFAGGEGGADAAVGREVASDLARELVEPLRERLERTLEDSDGDDSRSERAEAVSAVYRQWRGQEVERLSRHHAMAAFARGAYDGYGKGVQLRWVVDDEVPCPDCDDNVLAGAVVKGEAYPTGQLHPPAHPGCRCLLLPNVP